MPPAGMSSRRDLDVGFNIFNDQGVQVGRFGTAANFGGMQLLMNDSQGRTRIRLAIAEDGTPSIELLDADGKVTWSAR